MSKVQSSGSAKLACRRMMWITLAVSVACMVLYSIVLIPLYNGVSSNVLYDNTALPTVLYILMQSVEPIWFFAVYPVLFYALWRGGLRGARASLVSFGGCVLGKYVLNFTMTCVDEGALPSLTRFFEKDLPIIGGLILLELVQHVLVMLAACLWLRSYRRAFPWPAEGMTDRDAFLAARGNVFPLGKLPILQNPVMLMALSAAVIVLVGRLCNHLIYPMTLIFYNGWSYSGKVILLDVVADLVICAIGYLVSLLLLSFFDRRETVRLSET